MRTQSLSSHIKKGPRVGLAYAEKRAKVLAREWESDVHVYVDPNTVLFSQGGDEDHPRRKPTFVQTFVKPFKRRAVR